MTMRCLAVAVVVVVCAVACGSDDESGWKLSGTVTKSDVANGTVVYAKLVAQGADGLSPALYWTQASFTSGSAQYTISGVATGSYTLYAFIDRNGNAVAGAAAVPDSGDYIASLNVTIDKDTSLPAPEEDAWDTF